MSDDDDKASKAKHFSVFFGRRMEGLRAVKTLNRHDVADLTAQLAAADPDRYTEISHQRLARIELGRNKNVSLDDAITLCRIYDQNIGFLLHEAEENALVPDITKLFSNILDDSIRNKEHLALVRKMKKLPESQYEAIRALIVSLYRDAQPDDQDDDDSEA